jgi:tRNA(fMet)-specific endonuclease VapC
MRPLAIDTNAYAAFKRGDEAMVDVLKHAPDILFCAAVPGELLAGFAAGRRESANRRGLKLFIDSSRVRVVACTASEADAYARITPPCEAKADGPQ